MPKKVTKITIPEDVKIIVGEPKTERSFQYFTSDVVFPIICRIKCESDQEADELKRRLYEEFDSLVQVEVIEVIDEDEIGIIERVQQLQLQGGE